MASIVDHNVRRTELINNRLKEPLIGLVADPHADLLLFQRFARWINVNAHDASAWAEIPLPELQRTTLVDANLEDEGALPNIWCEISLIDGKVVRPLRHVVSCVLIEERAE